MTFIIRIAALLCISIAAKGDGAEPPTPTWVALGGEFQRHIADGERLFKAENYTDAQVKRLQVLTSV
jgi:hypothetical protein